MPLHVGLVGLPNVGKSTLFNALTRSSAAAAENFPFCTIDPNVGTVPLHDPVLPQLQQITSAKNILPETMEFVDIAGLVRGASQGEGLGNQFLSHIRECDAIAVVARCFHDDNIIHVDGKVDPQADRELIITELILADLDVATNMRDKAARLTKGGKTEDILRHAILVRLVDHLEAGNRAASLEVSDDEAVIFSHLPMITRLPMLTVANIDEGDLGSADDAKLAEQCGLAEDELLVHVCAKLEAELAGLDEEEAAELGAEMGLTGESGLQRLARAAHDLLGLTCYYTAGEQEVRAWTVPLGSTLAQSAGKIHSDFQAKFIRGDVVPTSDFIELGGWSKCREAGKVRTEGKDAVLTPDCVCLWKTGA